MKRIPQSVLSIADVGDTTEAANVDVAKSELACELDVVLAVHEQQNAS